MGVEGGLVWYAAAGVAELRVVGVFLAELRVVSRVVGWMSET